MNPSPSASSCAITSEALTVRNCLNSLTHRLRLAGCELPLFEPPAIEAIFQATQDMPRKINRLAHYALSAAALTKAKAVIADHVQAALDEITP